MKILQRSHVSKKAVATLAFTFSVATSGLAFGQDFVNAPLPTHYAGQTAALSIAESPRTHSSAAEPLKPTDVEHGRRLNGEVYDGLPIERRFDQPTAPRVPVVPRVEKTLDVPADGPSKSKKEVAELDEAQANLMDQDAASSGCQHENCRHENCRHENDRQENCQHKDSQHKDCQHEDNRCASGQREGCQHDLAEHLEMVEVVFNSGIIRKMLGLVAENIELKAQLKIQEIEFAARQQVQATERHQRETGQRIQDLQQVNEELRRNNQALSQLEEAQTNEATQRYKALERKLAESIREQSELLKVNRELKLKAEHQHATQQQTLQRAVAELDTVRRSKSELEHRTRTLESQLRELKDKMEGLHKAEKKKKKLR